MKASIGSIIYGIVSRALPAPPVPDGGNEIEARFGRYGDQSIVNVVPTKHMLADEGSYFVATNPTIGTGVAHALVTAFSATSALFVIKNTEKASDSKAKRVYLDYLKLFGTVAPTAGNSLEFAFVVDDVPRTPTAGNVLLTTSVVNPNMDDGTLPPFQVQAFNAAALTVPVAGQSARTVGRIKIPTGINVIGDAYEIFFGGTDQAQVIPPLTAIRAAQPGRFVASAAPIAIGPQQSLVIHRWALTEATTAPSYEYELGLFAR